MTFSAIDAKRADKKYTELIYEPLDTNGDIVNKSAATVDWN